VGSIHPRLADLETAAVAWAARNSARIRLASLGADAESSFVERDSQSEPRSAFGERFSFDQPGTPSWSSQASAAFDDRFTAELLGEGSAPDTAARSAAAAPRETTSRVAAAAVAPRAAARSVVAKATPKRPPDARFQLASASGTPLPTAYAPTDSVKGSSVADSVLKDLGPKDASPLADVDTSHTAIYDITAHTVYLPNGKRLEAHSGLGSQMDDPRYVNERMTGPTPPNVYELKLRERPFHGVRAIRLNPIDGSKMHGRDGILAHSYMLGSNGQSNGCVSFSDYAAFLDAFQRGDVDRLVVVEHLANAPSPRTASDWFSDTLKDIFKRS
jgi:hypothetical protein